VDVVNEFASAFGLVDLDHVGLAVHDVDDAIARYRSVLGLSDWVRASFESAATWRGEEGQIGANVASAPLGAIRIELVEPTKGEWTAAEWLETHGEGIYHVGYRVTDLPATLEHLAGLGVTPELVGHDAGAPFFAYLDREALCGVTVEVIGPIPERLRERLTTVS
jgi:catechol 2,3-dioxygenase-like lactoylglutathione lyase family enzyme